MRTLSKDSRIPATPASIEHIFEVISPFSPIFRVASRDLSIRFIFLARSVSLPPANLKPLTPSWTSSETPAPLLTMQGFYLSHPSTAVRLNPSIFDGTRTASAIV